MEKKFHTETVKTKMWSGRFEKDTDELVDAFNASLPFDIRLYQYDIMGSIAHCTMLGKCGIIPSEDANAIAAELKRIEEDIEANKVEISGEDVHMFVEGELIRRLGDTGKKLHTARSRNDQVATDFRLYVRKALRDIQGGLRMMIATIAEIAGKNTDTIACGYTHLQKAQPVTLAHHLMAYAEMFNRDFDRLSDCCKRLNILPLGSSALASTTYPIDRETVAKLLDFDGVTDNSIDGVSDRDFAVEYTFCLSLIAMHLSRFSEEIILWATDEFKFIELDDAFATGSSIMPQKKNPDIAELVRGKTGRVYGDLLTLLTVLKGIPLAYNKDMQEDKEAVFDATDTVMMSLTVFAKMLQNTTFLKDTMRKSADGGYTNATDVADYLVRKGMPFRDAHAVVGRLVLDCVKRGARIQDLTLSEFQNFSPVFEQDILDAVKIENVVNNRNVTGGPSAGQVRRHIDKIKKKFNL